MSGIHNHYGCIILKNRVLRDILKKYKDEGAFDSIYTRNLGISGHLLIVDTIDGVEHEFNLKCPGLGKTGELVPQNIYQVTHLIYEILDYLIPLGAARVPLKWELMEKYDFITQNYEMIDWEFGYVESEYGMYDDVKSDFFRLEEDSISCGSECKKVSYNSKEAELDQSDNKLKQRMNKATAEYNFYASSFRPNIYEPEIRPRDIQQTKIWAESEEGRKHNEKLWQENRERNRKAIGERGGMQCPIEYFDFSKKAYNSLKKAGIRTLGDLCALLAEELMRIKGIYRSGFIEIAYSLVSCGVDQFKEELEELTSDADDDDDFLPIEE